jgi:hypothetical protein
MFVNKIPFFLLISWNIRFITAKVLDNRTQPSLMKALQRIHDIYRLRGFRIKLILSDSELECTRGTIATHLQSQLNICGKDEHIPDIERCICTTKERTRCAYNLTPFDHYPPRMIIEMVFLSIFWINAFPHRLGVSQTLSPRTLVTGQAIDYTKHCRVESGQYVQTHEKHDNTRAPRTVGALALHPTGNQQGGHYFYSLMSGRWLHRTHWTELPIPAEVRDRVHALAPHANANCGLTFTDSDGTNLDTLYPAAVNDDDDSDYDPDDDNDGSYTSSEDSDYDHDEGSTSHHSNASDRGFNRDLPVPQPVEIVGVEDTIDTNNGDGATLFQEWTHPKNWTQKSQEWEKTLQEWIHPKKPTWKHTSVGSQPSWTMKLLDSTVTTSGSKPPLTQSTKMKLTTFTLMPLASKQAQTMT